MIAEIGFIGLGSFFGLILGLFLAKQLGFIANL
jgi:hypothetical protein